MRDKLILIKNGVEYIANNPIIVLHNHLALDYPAIIKIDKDQITITKISKNELQNKMKKIKKEYVNPVY